jgi:hypothetical protein
MTYTESRPLSMERLHHALSEAQRLTQGQAGAFQEKASKIVRSANAGAHELAEQARRAALRDCVRLGDELVKLGQRLKKVGAPAPKAHRKLRKAH